MREATLDSMGRIVIPKTVRVRLGLAAGTVLEIDEADGALVLRRVPEEAPLRREGSVLVFAGTPLAPLEDAVVRTRDERLGHLGAFRP